MALSRTSSCHSCLSLFSSQQQDPPGFDLVHLQNRPSVRDPAQAVRLARRATAATGGKSVAIFETLAGAHAAAGQFDRAGAEAAIKLADDEGQDAAVERLREKLTLFQNGESYPP